MKIELVESVTPKTMNCVYETRDEDSIYGQKEKNLYLSGICIQGGIRNANQRVYPVDEIAKAVKTLNDQIDNGYTVWGHTNHPNDLQIDLEKVSHMITSMWMEGPNGYGKLKIVNNHPMGLIIRSLVEAGGKLGVSSRGSGNVSEDGNNTVSDFEIVTIDIVATPSGPGCYPTPIYEHLMNNKGGYNAYQLAEAATKDPSAKKYIQKSLLNIINGLK